MEIRITKEKKNPLLKRREIYFEVMHDQTGSTPQRLDVRKAVAAALKVSTDLVFVKRLETKRGTQKAVGVANVYDTTEQATFVEPEYIIKRNTIIEKPKAKEKG